MNIKKNFSRKTRVVFITERFSIFMVVMVLLFISCSSAPKRPAQITTTYNLAVNQLDSANVESERGNYKLAGILLEEVWKLAVSIDSVELRVLTQLSQGNLAFYQNNQEIAESMWNAALVESEKDHNEELIALSKIYKTRGILSWGAAENKDKDAQKVIDIVSDRMGILKKSNQLYLAYAWMLMGFAKKQLGQWQQAESYFKTSLKIHEDMLYLELAAYDWYAIASVRSVAGQYEQAVKAMQNAIDFDRRAENSFGLGSDYLALGDIYKKAGQKELSEEAFKRSKEIFDSSSLLNTPD